MDENKRVNLISNLATSIAKPIRNLPSLRHHHAVLVADVLLLLQYELTKLSNNNKIV